MAGKKSRTPNPSVGPLGNDGAPFNEQDPQRRLGNFEGAGEPSRKGSRSAGIVGQTKQQNSTDKKTSHSSGRKSRSGGGN